MPAPPDRRPPDILEQKYPAFPLPPLNISVTSSFRPESLDIKWSDPQTLPANTCFNIVGVNLYRSFDSEYGPYYRVNSVPIGGNYYRDETTVVFASNEDASNNLVLDGFKDGMGGQHVICVKNRPIYLQNINDTDHCTDFNVCVLINGKRACIEYIDAERGLIELSRRDSFDVANQKVIRAVLPSEGDLIQVTYRYKSNSLKTNLNSRIFYRLTTVSYDDKCNRLVETPLDRATQGSRHEIEKLDYIWREAVRRQKWILFQGGERVKLFIRKTAGLPCGCVSEEHGQPKNDCPVCFGTAYIGGYEGPYDIIITPDDAEKKIAQTNRGRNLEHSYDVWTSPSPLISQRDFIVKQNNDRYGIGPVRTTSHRGMILQQFFNIGYLDEPDTRYKVPMFDPKELRSPETRWIIPGQGRSTPMMSEKDNIEEWRELRGKTVTWENIMY